MSNTFQHQVCYSFFIRLNIASDCDWWPRTRDPLLTILDVYEYLLPVMSICLTFACQDKLTHSRGEKKPCLIDQQPSTLRFRPLKKVILRPLRSLWRSCAADPMLGVLEEHQDEWLQLTIWKRSLFSINKKWQLLKCGVCLHFESPELIWVGLQVVVFPFSLHRFPTCRNLRWWFARWALCSVPRWENLVGWSMRRLPVLNIVLVGCTALGSALPSKRLLYCQRCGSLDALALFEQLSLDAVSAFESARSFSAPCTSERSGSKSKVCPFHIISDVRF